MFLLQIQLFTAKSQYWLHKTGASHEHWQLETQTIIYEQKMET